jgi:hypothetical protein
VFKLKFVLKILSCYTVGQEQEPEPEKEPPERPEPHQNFYPEPEPQKMMRLRNTACHTMLPNFVCQMATLLTHNGPESKVDGG